jgi:hypothetical protein
VSNRQSERATSADVAALSDSLTKLLRFLMLQITHCYIVICTETTVFFKFKGTLVKHVTNDDLSPSAWADMRQDIQHVIESNYALQLSKDVSFEVGRLLMAMKDFTAALTLFSESQVQMIHNV